MKVNIPATGYVSCDIDGCGRRIEAAGLCAGHRKRKTRGQVVGVPLQAPRGELTPWQLLEKATDEYWECDIRDDHAFTQAGLRLAYAARVFAASRRSRERLNESSHPSGAGALMGTSRTAVARFLAAKSKCDERTIHKVLRGEPVRGKAGQRALKAVLAAGLKPSRPNPG